MKEYHFQYTKMWATIGVMLSAIAVFMLSIVVGAINSKLNTVLIIAISFALAYLVFQMLKRNVVHNCTAKLGDSSVLFEFKSYTKTINFHDLSSYKCYYGKNGPMLYLNSNTENFLMFPNDVFCNTDEFRIFCKDIIAQLDKYSETHNFSLTHEGSVFTKKA